MRHITIRLEDDRFDDMPADEVPALIFDMIRHDLWHLTDPRVHLSEIAIDVPPEPEQPAISAADVDHLMETLDVIARTHLPDKAA